MPFRFSTLRTYSTSKIEFKGINKQLDEPKRHIVLLGKNKIIGVEDKIDVSEDYNKLVDISPFVVNADPCILLANENAPYLRRDHK